MPPTDPPDLTSGWPFTPGVGEDMLLRESFNLLRKFWRLIPYGYERVLSTDLRELADDELLAKWSEAHRKASTGEAFAHRGWYQTLYRDAFRGKKILDFGCGLGIDTVFYAEHGARVTFVDIVESNVEVVRRVCLLKRLSEVDFCYLKDLSSLGRLPLDYDVIYCQGSLIPAPFEVARLEAQELLKHLPVGGRWIELGYPRARWEREGSMPFHRWGEQTDGGAPWMEWRDLNKVRACLAPAVFDVVLELEFHDRDFVWFDLIRRPEGYRPVRRARRAEEYPISGIPPELPTGPTGTQVFASDLTVQLNRARLAHLEKLGLPLAGRSVLDVGCGVGDLTPFFTERGCKLVAVDGRKENIRALQSQYPNVTARVADVETESLTRFGVFDVVLCYGLLYHLENPVAGLRNIAQVCRDLLLVETMVCDQAAPMAKLVDESDETFDQSLRGLACRPSPGYVTMALNRVGFSYVYAPKTLPDQASYQFEWLNTGEHVRDGDALRCVFVASRRPLDNPNLRLLLAAPRGTAGAVPFVPPAGVAGLPARPEPAAAVGLAGWTPAQAYWNQRDVLAASRKRILELIRAVDRPVDLSPFQFAQLTAAALEFAPQLILELGRGKGNATCAFTEAANLLGPGRCHVLSICPSDDWSRETVPRLSDLVPPEWFAPLSAEREDLLRFDYRKALAGAGRVLVFWDAHGFEVAECVLGKILPEIADREHLVAMHDILDARYNSPEYDQYGGLSLWKGSGRGGARLRLGFVDSDVEQVISVLDFATRNRIGLHSADSSFEEELGRAPARVEELTRLLGPELFSLRGHWFWFSLREHSGPYTFPWFETPRD